MACMQDTSLGPCSSTWCPHALWHSLFVYLLYTRGCTYFHHAALTVASFSSGWFPFPLSPSHFFLSSLCSMCFYPFSDALWECHQGTLLPPACRAEREEESSKRQFWTTIAFMLVRSLSWLHFLPSTTGLLGWTEGESCSLAYCRLGCTLRDLGRAWSSENKEVSGGGWWAVLPCWLSLIQHHWGCTFPPLIENMRWLCSVLLHV